jgi:hypothetical protein
MCFSPKKILLLVFFCWAVLYPYHAIADMSSWTYEIEVSIDNTLNIGALSDYQIKVTFNTQALIAAGKMESDGKDIRFTDVQDDDTTMLDYWIETGTINTTATNIWVKVPSIPAASTKTIYLYYGNVAAGAVSSGGNTFDFFDDFDALDLGVWSKTYASSDVSGSRLTVARGSVYTDAAVLASPLDKLIEAKISWSTDLGSYSGMMISDDQATQGSNRQGDALIYYMSQSGNGNMRIYFWAADGTTTSYNIGAGNLFQGAVGTPYVTGMVITSDNMVKFFKDDTQVASRSGSWDAPVYFWLGYFTGSSAGSADGKDIDVDWVRVREYTPTEPAVSLYFPISKLEITSAPQTITKNQASSVITVQTQSDEGLVSATTSDVTINLSSSSATGQFSATDSPFVPVTQMTVTAGSSSVAFYYRDANVGAHTISVAESPSQGWADDNQAITVLTYSGAATEEDMTLWSYSAPVEVSNASCGSALSDYQVLFTLNTSALVALGKIKADGSDIRFLDEDNSTQLPYWIETGTMNTTATNIWIKVPSIPAGATKNIYMYYGNDLAVWSSYADFVFDFFDDFDTFDSSLWTATHISTTVSNSELLIERGAVYNNNPISSVSQDKLVEAKVRWTSSSGSYSGMMLSDDQATAGSNRQGDALIYYMTLSGNNDMRVYYWAADGTTSSYNLGSGNLFTSVVGASYVLGFASTSDNNIKFYKDHLNIYTRNGSWNAPFYSFLGYFTGAAAGSADIKDIAVDWIRVRKYSTCDVTATINLPVAKLNFSTSPQTVIEDRASSVITIETQDDTGLAQTVSSNTPIRLSSTSSTGEFSLSPTFSTLITSVTVPSGSSSASFYYRDATVGTHTLLAAEDPSQGWTDASQTVIIRPMVLLANYRRPVTVTSCSAGILTDFQVLLTMDTQSLVSAGKMQADGDDIRFVDSDDITLLSYWIEPSSMNTVSTKIWVKIPSLPVSPAKTIYMYYGNPVAVADSNGQQTFGFFDDFNTLDTAVWGATHSSTGVLNSEVIIQQGAIYTSAPVLTSTQDRYVEAKLKWSTNLGSYSGLMIANDHTTAGSNSQGDALVYYMTQSSNTNMRVYYWAADGTRTNYNLGAGNLFTAIVDQPYILGILIASDNTIKFYRDFTNIFTRNGYWNEPFHIFLGYFTGAAAGSANGKDIYVDWVRVREYDVCEPSTMLGAEENSIAQISFITSEQSLVQNKGSAIMTVETQDQSGNAVNVFVDTRILLSSTSAGGEFSDGSNFASVITEVLIPAGQNRADFYYRDSVTGTAVITAAESPAQGWADAQQDVTVINAVHDFSVIVDSPQVVGRDFTMTISALDEDGNVITTYNDPATLSVNHVSPNTSDGVLAQTAVTAFVNGVAEMSSQSYSECGTINVTVTHDASQTTSGSSPNIYFSPHDFLVAAQDLDGNSDVIDGGRHTVNKVFALDIQARKPDGSLCQGYSGPASVSVVDINPAISQGSSFSVSSLVGQDWSNGLARLDGLLYDMWGEVQFQCQDDTMVSQAGTSSTVAFIPKALELTLSEPMHARTYYYTDESFSLRVRVLDENNSVITNYQGNIICQADSLSLPESYDFLASDLGAVTFLDVHGLSPIEQTNIYCQDSLYSEYVNAMSEEIEIRNGTIKVFSDQGAIGELTLTVAVMDDNGDVMTEDNSTTFWVTLNESNDNKSASSPAVSELMTMDMGQATITISDTEAETVEVIPSSKPILRVEPGTATFGTVSSTGIGIQMYREVKDEKKKK